MLSVIICSANPSLLASAKANIAATAGVPHEFIVIDNRNGQHGICSAYNAGGRQAQYPLLCFVHEDVRFETNNWGQIVCSLLSDPHNGVIGVAGGDTISSVPSTWSVPAYSNEVNIIQHYKHTLAPEEHIKVTNQALPGAYKRVVALDGVFLCTRKEIFQAFEFDEKTFPAFHGYDVDFSFRVGRHYQLVVTFDILIRHYSEGKPDRTWLKSIYDFRNKWKDHLPASIHKLNRSHLSLHHWNSLQVLLKHLQRLNYSKPFVYYTLLKYGLTRHFNFRRFLYTLRSIMFSKGPGTNPKASSND